MNRTLLAALLAGATFATTAIAQTAPMPPEPTGVETRDQAMARADARFDRLDINHDGKLTPAELAAMRRMAPPPADGAAPAPSGRPDRGDRMFARLDTNGDGVVDRAEFRAQAARRFDRVDANHDGVIDAAERQAVRDAMGDRMGQRHGRRGTPADGGAMPPPPPPAPAPAPDTGQ
ncbi:MAG: EF-hand domain-containing protein [Sphingomonas sp.]|uniref:EF-hand domain-containing protein n=1 Tax=Sphingomonas sp. TaxID=28214 RepID=UPI001ACD9DA9|nr:EF-hand domain-containing protein [Sphingomonas sp.]MBN8807146.1 EF-hand domain-containing protein [Sphingomonas sp.]